MRFYYFDCLQYHDRVFKHINTYNWEILSLILIYCSKALELYNRQKLERENALTSQQLNEEAKEIPHEEAKEEIKETEKEPLKEEEENSIKVPSVKEEKKSTISEHNEQVYHIEDSKTRKIVYIAIARNPQEVIDEFLKIKGEFELL